MDILLTGGTGQVGLELLGLSWPDDVRLHAPARAELDLADPDSVARAVASRTFSAILSCGAYTAVDRAEQEVRAAWTANALGPAILAEAAAKAGIPIVHVSTDYVFSGAQDTPYGEDDPVAPQSVYGASKEGGEQAVRTTAPRHAIVRSAWVMSARRTNFLKTMLRLAGDRDEVGVVADQTGCPTFAADLAAALSRIVLRLMRDPGAQTGTFHVVNRGEASWADVAEAVFAASRARGGPSARVARITTAEYPTPARRPANSRLATGKIERHYGLEMRPWRTALEEAVATLTPDVTPPPP